MNLLQTYPQLKIIKEMALKKKCDVYLVGGFLRDSLLKKKKMDFDFALSHDGVAFARSLARKMKGSYVLLDKERGCARVCKKEKGALFTYDFANFRAKTFKADLKKRDFTINTLAIHINTLTEEDSLESVLMISPQSKKDLYHKKVRMGSAKIFNEDPLRILRAYSVKEQLNFKIEASTLSQMKKDKNRLVDVSSERIRDELFKVLASHTCGVYLKQMDRDGILEMVLPQIRIMYNCKQGTYHHLDVWPHSLETVKQLDVLLEVYVKDPELQDYLNESLAGERKRLHIMRLAALFHDVGKPDTRLRKNGRISFHGHEHVGKSIVREVSRMLKLSTKERYVCEDIVRWHLRPGYLSNFKKPSDRAIYRYFRDTKDEAISILLVSLADQRSTCGVATTAYDQKHHEKICLTLIKRYIDQSKEKRVVPLIKGDDLIHVFNLKPSPLFGRIVAHIEEQQNLKKVSTKKEALALVRKFINKGSKNAKSS